MIKFGECAAVINAASCGSDSISIGHLQSLSHKVCPIKGGGAKEISMTSRRPLNKIEG